MPAAVPASSLVALPEAGALATHVAHWVAGELQRHFAKTVSSARVAAITIDGNHMVVEARRLAPESEPFRAFSGPRKKQPQFSQVAP